MSNEPKMQACGWCRGTGFLPSTGIMCRTCSGGGMVAALDLVDALLDSRREFAARGVTIDYDAMMEEIDGPPAM